MMSCTRNVLDTDVLKKTFQDEKFALNLKNIINPAKNFLFVTSKSKTEIEIQGFNFQHVITTVENLLDGKIHFVEISPEIKDNVEFYKEKNSEFSKTDLENIVYCKTTNSILLTQDKTKKGICKINEKIGVAI